MSAFDALDREAAVKALDWLRHHAERSEAARALVVSKLGPLLGVPGKRTESGVGLRAVRPKKAR